MTDSVAIQHCNTRLAKARDALDRLANAKGFAQAESAWSDLLLAASGIYSKLQKASEKDAKASGWYGRVKHERRTDPLLSYIHHARNSDEHGLLDITARRSKGMATFEFLEPFDPMKLDGKVIKIGTDARGHVRIEHSAPDLFAVKHFDRPTMELNRVKDDRYGDWFKPPTEHLGVPLPDQSPLTVAKKIVPYLERLISEARAMGI